MPSRFHSRTVPSREPVAIRTADDQPIHHHRDVVVRAPVQRRWVRQIDQDAIAAAMHNGTLTLTLPKVKALQPRRIAVT